jgi:hypothetical protein
MSQTSILMLAKYWAMPLRKLCSPARADPVWETVSMPRLRKPSSMCLTNAYLVTLRPESSGNSGEYSGPPNWFLAQIACSLMAQAGHTDSGTTASAPRALGQAQVWVRETPKAAGSVLETESLTVTWWASGGPVHETSPMRAAAASIPLKASQQHATSVRCGQQGPLVTRGASLHESSERRPTG